jgi:AraC family transcriptional activator of tynA and feaB
MKTLFSTADVRVSHRFDYWHSVACENIVDHDSIPENRRAFRAELQSGTLDDLGLVLFENSPMSISHTVRHLARAAIDEIFVCRQVGGQLAFEQDGREVLLEPGDMTLLDPRLPYAGTFFRSSRLLVLKIPRGDIVVMDNLRAHKVAGVKEAIEAAGAELRYLP